MVHTYLVPSWFLGYDIIMQLVFAIITLTLSIYAFRLYKLSNQRPLRLFASSFLFISLAYLAESTLNFLALSKLDDQISLAMKLFSFHVIETIGFHFRIILFTIGLVVLAYMTLRVKSVKTLSLLLIVALLALLFTENPLFLYHLLSSVLLVYISLHYLFHYLEHKRANTLMMVFAFTLILLSNIQFIFSVNYNAVCYAVGYFLELAAYLLILINLMMVRKYEQKKRPASGHP
jgi:hypothetical protein